MNKRQRMTLANGWPHSLLGREAVGLEGFEKICVAEVIKSRSRIKENRRKRDRPSEKGGKNK